MMITGHGLLNTRVVPFFGNRSPSNRSPSPAPLTRLSPPLMEGSKWPC